MNRAVAAIAVGLFTLAAFAALLIANREVGSGEARRPSYDVVAHFGDVSGLVEGSEVRMHGFPVGRLKGIALEQRPDGSARAAVTVAVDEGIRLREGLQDEASGRWHSGAMIRRRQASLLGDYYLELIPGSAGPDLRRGGTIRLVESTSGIERALAQLDKASAILPRIQQIADDIGAITSNAREVLGGPEGQKLIAGMAEDLRGAANDIREVAAVLRGFSETGLFQRGDSIDRIITNVERFSGNAAKLSDTAQRYTGQILADVSKTTKTVRELVTGKSGEVESTLGTFTGTLKSAELALQKLHGVLDELHETTAGINRGQGTIGKLVRDDELADKIEGVVDDVRSFTGSVSRLDIGWGLRSEYNFKAQGLKHYFTLRLQPSVDKYYMLQIIDDPRGNTSVRRRVTQTNDPTLPPVLYESTTETTDRLKISLQFARRWNFLTARIGIFESTGGVGGDAHFLGDKLGFSTEAFDFSSDVRPRLKMWMAWTAIPHVTLLAGVDDLVSDNTRDFFAGLFIYFTDKDLKTVFAAAPSVQF